MRRRRPGRNRGSTTTAPHPSLYLFLRHTKILSMPLVISMTGKWTQPILCIGINQRRTVRSGGLPWTIYRLPIDMHSNIWWTVNSELPILIPMWFWTPGTTVTFPA